MLFFLIGMSYSILSPIIIPFFVLYYAFGYVVWIYQLLHVYIPEWEHGGQFWPEVFYRLACMYCSFEIRGEGTNWKFLLGRKAALIYWHNVFLYQSKPPMFPSYRNQSVDLQRKSGFYMMGILVVKRLNYDR